jgi:hypothetical protein
MHHAIGHEGEQETDNGLYENHLFIRSTGKVKRVQLMNQLQNHCCRCGPSPELRAADLQGQLFVDRDHRAAVCWTQAVLATPRGSYWSHGVALPLFSPSVVGIQS